MYTIVYTSNKTLQDNTKDAGKLSGVITCDNQYYFLLLAEVLRTIVHTRIQYVKGKGAHSCTFILR